MLQFGLNEDTPYMVSKYAMLLCGGLGEMKDGVRFGSLSLKFLELYNEREVVVSLVVYSFVLHWKAFFTGRLPLKIKLIRCSRVHQLVWQTKT